MAQVKIFGLLTALDACKDALSDAIHSAVMEALTYPAEKRFHRFFGLDQSDFIYPANRSERYVIIEISIFEGRSVAAKKALIRALYERIPAATGITAEDIEITLLETPRHSWGIRGLPGDELGLSYKVEV